EDIFYYVYGVLHSPEYRTRFAADLKKMLPRIPLTQEAKDFQAFSAAGRELAHWHLNYETVQPWPLVEHIDRLNFDASELFQVQKMTFARPTPSRRPPARNGIRPASSTTATSRSRKSRWRLTTTSSTASRPSSGSWSATRSPATRTVASSTIPTTGAASTTSPATSSTWWAGWCE